jgi:hypothetical protein
MREFMMYIRNDGKELPANQEQEFLKACEDYIGALQSQGRLISAQPLGDEGRIVSKSAKGWAEQSYRSIGEVNAGYYHIRANDLADAVEIAKRNPEFRYRPTAKIEVRDIKTEEDTTGYVYPSESPKKS